MPHWRRLLCVFHVYDELLKFVSSFSSSFSLASSAARPQLRRPIGIMKNIVRCRVVKKNTTRTDDDHRVKERALPNLEQVISCFCTLLNTQFIHRLLGRRKHPNWCHLVQDEFCFRSVRVIRRVFLSRNGPVSWMIIWLVCGTIPGFDWIVRVA